VHLTDGGRHAPVPDSYAATRCHREPRLDAAICEAQPNDFASLRKHAPLLLRTSEDIPADEGATEFEECFVNVGATLKANAKTTKVAEPCVSTLDHPSKFARTSAVLGPALCDHRLDAAFAKFAAMWFGVAAAISVNDFGLLRWPAMHSR